MFISAPSSSDGELFKSLWSPWSVFTRHISVLHRHALTISCNLFIYFNIFIQGGPVSKKLFFPGAMLHGMIKIYNKHV